MHISLKSLVVVAIACSTCFGENIALNGSFEEGDEYWALQPNASITDEFSSDRESSLALRGSAIAGQILHVGEADTEYQFTVSFDAMVEPNGGLARASFMLIDQRGDRGGGILYVEGSMLDDTDANFDNFIFGPYSIPVTGEFPNESYMLGVSFLTGSTAEARMWIDNVVVDYRPVPEPATGALVMAVALMMMLLRRCYSR